MDEHDAQQRRDTDYEETIAPQNPPNSMVRPQARTRWWASSFGVVTAIFIVVVIAFVVVMLRNAADDGAGLFPDSEVEGTSGDSPGGFDPAPRPDNTRDELEFRGAGEEP